MTMARQRLGSMTHLEIARWSAIALTLAALALSLRTGGGPLNVISTLAYLTVTGFAALDGAGALPASLGTRPYMWTLIIPVSIAINVVAGTLLAAIGPGLTSGWLWVACTTVVAAGETASALRRRTR